MNKRMIPMVVPAMLAAVALSVGAAEYRGGVQGAASAAFAAGQYFENYKKIPIAGGNRGDLVAVALSQLGYQEGDNPGDFSGETAGDNNYVEYSYNMGDFGLGYGGEDYPWCASFVSWCLYQSGCTNQGGYADFCRFHAGEDAYIWKEVGCASWVEQLEVTGYYRKSGLYRPQSGDLIFFQDGGRVCHVGIVVYTQGDRVYTVEGNTSDGAGLDANGGGVYLKKYSLSSDYIHGYGVLPYQEGNLPDYTGGNPAPGLYISTTVKYIFRCEQDEDYAYILPRFRIFTVTEICENGRLKGNFTDREGNAVTGYIMNNSDRILPLTCDARLHLQEIMNKAGQARYYHYSQAAITRLRTVYAGAKAILENSQATQRELSVAADRLAALLLPDTYPVTSQPRGAYISGKNRYVYNGDCVLFTAQWEDGNITVDNANTAYSLSLRLRREGEGYVVVSKHYGMGQDTPPIRLQEGECLLVCHEWEEVPGSITNYAILESLQPGDELYVSGVTAWGTDSSLMPASYAVSSRQWDS